MFNQGDEQGTIVLSGQVQSFLLQIAGIELGAREPLLELSGARCIALDAGVGGHAIRERFVNGSAPTAHIDNVAT
jgi:hypothetical protein